MRRRLEAFVAFERGCCADYAWALERPAPGRLRLRVDGLPPDSRLFALTRPERADPSGGRLGRLVRAAGAGTAITALVCCALPFGIAAVAGAAVAAPFAVLDTPSVMIPVGVVAGIGIWLWQRRRAACASGAGCGDGCGDGCSRTSA